MVEPRDQHGRQEYSGNKHETEMHDHRRVGGVRRRIVSGLLAEGEAAQMVEQRTERDEDAEHKGHCEQRLARKGRTDDQELAHENPEGRKSGNRNDADHEAPAEPWMGYGEAPDLGDPLRALDLRDVADG